jgi:hypothetical protein
VEAKVEIHEDNAMNIEEARKVLWLKNNHRPLGELLDEGYLTKDRLEWAAKKAYEPALKQAAQVILESLNHSPAVNHIEEKPTIDDVNVKDAAIEVGISLEKARATIWPFSSHRGKTMGALVDAKELSLKDLGYAAETARDEKVREAATALALVKLNQIVKEPGPSAGFVHVISGGRSFAQRRETLFTLLQGAFFGFLLTSLIFWLVRSFRGTGTPNPNAGSLSELVSAPGGLFSLIVALIILIFIGWLANFVTDKINNRLDKQIEQYRRGQEGEDDVVQLIVQALDGNWYLFRNIGIPGRNKGDLDLVLVGPPGVWALEVKNFRGEYRNIGETWEWKNGKNWKAARGNPSRQANNSAYRLKNFLKADHVNAFVNSAVIWANSESPLTVENPSVAVWRYDRLPDELGNIWQGEKLSEIERNKIVEKLTRLCEQQRNSS